MTIDSPVVEDAAVAPGNRQLVPIEIAHADLYHRAAQTWRGLKNAQRQAWDQYVIIGEAMAAARAMIMRQRHLNQPAGPSYQRAFREWLASFGLDDMDKGTRSRLCGLIDHLPEVQGMMAAWSDAERADRGHPNTVHRYFQKWLAKMGQPNTAKAKLLDRAKRTAATASENKQLKAEAERSAAYIAELEAARDADDAPRDAGDAPIGIVRSGLVELIDMIEAGDPELDDALAGISTNGLDKLTKTLKGVVEQRRRSSRKAAK